MKILIVQDRLRSGGTERQAILMARLFREAGHDARLLTFRPGGALWASAQDLAPRALQPFDLGLDWFAPGLLRHARRLAPEVVLCMGRMANCRGGDLQRALGRDTCAVVATLRTGKPLPLRFQRSLGDVAHVVANSNDSGRTLAARYAVPPHKISVIHNALVFPPSAAPDPALRSEIRARHQVPTDTPVMLWVGMFRPEKDQRALLHLLKRLPEELPWQLWFAGEGSERPGCEALARALGLAKRIRFLGFQRDPTPLYAGADVAVLTSRSESLSNFLIEAHAHGLPSVAYGVTGVGECGGTVVPPDDADAFLGALRRLLTSSDLRAAEGLRVAAWAREAFAPAKQAAAYLRLFEALRTPLSPAGTAVS